MSTARMLAALSMLASCASACAGVSSTWTLASDYDFRGITQTAQKPAVQASIDYAHEAKSNDALVAAIARETATSTDLVKALYEEEVAALTAGATVRQFISVIATKRVKQTLRRLGMAGT